MKRLYILIAIILTFLLQACSLPPEFDDEQYAKYSEQVLAKIEKKADYKRLPFESFDQAEQYISLEYKAFKKIISKEEFIKQLKKLYPDYDETILFLADQLPK